MLSLPRYKFWLVVGSQQLYGSRVIEQVAEHAQHIARALNEAPEVPYEIECKPVATSAEDVRRLCAEANFDDTCAGIITWMHTFSPARMWIAGLVSLNKPLLHLHTQYLRTIPWDTIDMDYMNLHQSAHGDREYGHIGARTAVARKVVAGHWTEPTTRKRVGAWMRSAVAAVMGPQLKVARFGDNMRGVAVTEGDKVEAQLKFGWTVDGYGVGDLVAYINAVTDAEVDRLLQEYTEQYEVSAHVRDNGAAWQAVREQARIEAGLRGFLTDGGYTAFTTTFEDLHGMRQLPGLAVQRLMADGYGFGAEGDWKTAALLRTMKVMAGGQGTSFMEDYTYHLQDGRRLILWAHMLEVCPTIAAGTPRIEVHPLSIGGKADPARLVFDGRAGDAVVASLVDLGHRFRLVVNTVEAVPPEQPMPRLPVARVLWKPKPEWGTAAEAWILAGGAHHTCFSYAVEPDLLRDWAAIVGIEAVVIDDGTDLRTFQERLQWNEVVWARR